MRKLWTKLIGAMVMVFLVFPEIAMAAGAKGAPLIVVAHTTKLAGWRAYFANLYNDDLVLFTVFTAIAVPLAGAFLGLITDYFMGKTGIDLTHRELKEH
ncbi:MAG: hypothetical protein KJ739_07200 [Nitrospinae bacterium]|nr:hypothetical protein [Nitrospinota bacterium]